MHVPVITIDGPSGSGKGTISQLLARHLGWHFLDSGALYRVLGYAADKAGMGLEDEKALTQLAMYLPVQFEVGTLEGGGGRILLENEDISLLIRTEACGNLASKVSGFAGVRTALVQRQRDFRQAPGLVADGRDMGTVIFPGAENKFFLEASVEIRAKRRFEQLKGLGQSVSLQSLFSEMAERDARDRNRAVCPLVPALDAVVIDTSDLSIPQVFDRVLAVIRKSGEIKLT